MSAKQTHSQFIAAGWVVMAMILVGVTGCPEDRPKTSVREVVGTIEQVDTNSNVVKVRAYVAKHEAYNTFTVRVNDETEIMINGTLAKLGDLRVGERAEGRILIEKLDGANVFTAQAVKVERGEVLQAPSDRGESPPSAGDVGSSGTEDGD